MSGQFKVGEIAVLQNCVQHPELNGEEVIIAGSFDCYKVTLRSSPNYGAKCFSYRVTLANKPMPNGLVFMLAQPHQLRRKPPKQDTYEWAASKVRDLLKVQPEKVTA